jgi:hypothetical protein
MIISDGESGFYVSDYPVNIFVEDIGVLMLLILPAAIAVVLWKVFVTNRTTPRGNVLSLGLDETSATDTELYGREIPWRALFLYAAVGVTTFEFGVFVYETFYSIQQWFSKLNGGIY